MDPVAVWRDDRIESERDRHTALTLLNQPVRVPASQRLYESRLAMRHVAGRRDGHIRLRHVVSNPAFGYRRW